ncbi:MAG: YgiQ family radical SAM protein [Bacteroidia bacterium]|nr:YgiQ family radical SAM protein [Bacteroidia bacterium]
MNSDTRLTDWLPTTLKEVKLRGWKELDVIIFIGDAYVDHPSFGAAVIGRIIEAEGFRVAIVPQPNWRDDLRDFKKLGKPRLFFGVTSGAMDSMINHYTANLRLRSDDAYTPGGLAGNRPDSATVVYSKILKNLYPDTPVIIGGIEASLRRLSHYDYWFDEIKPSILIESNADLLVYGMGEQAIREIIRLLDKNVPFNSLKNIPQTAFITKERPVLLKSSDDMVELFSFGECKNDKKKFTKNFTVIEEESNKQKARRIFEKTGNQYVVVNPPYPTMNESSLDQIYELPFTRLPHPKYQKTIPAFEMIKFSVISHRGCFGGCSFCTLAAHQGKFISSRSEKSVLKEIETITRMPGFRGYISDIGGPTANMYRLKGINSKPCEKCNKTSCIYPVVCKNLDTNHQPLLQLYKNAGKIKGIKKITIGSGLRYDLIFDGKNENVNNEYLKELVLHHVSGRLKVAPEHISDAVLKLMRKPSFELFKRLLKVFNTFNIKYRLNQQLIPYFISSHPGCSNTDMAELAIETKKLHFKLEQVQDFTPTPMTLASVMYYTGFDPNTLQKIHIPRTQEEKLGQRKFFFWYKKEYRGKIINDLKRTGRTDLLKRLFE